jgi:signal peptidase I
VRFAGSGHKSQLSPVWLVKQKRRPIMWRQRARKFWREWVKPIAVVGVVLCSFRSVVADWNVVPTGSMNPTIAEGDRIFVNRLAYGLKVPFTTIHVARWDEPKRGEVVVFNSPKDGERLVKRVIGVPGDTIELINNQLLLNGKSATYAPLANGSTNWMSATRKVGNAFATETIGGQSHPVMGTPRLRALRNFGPVTVPAGKFLVLGDNRDNSADSRFIGFVPLENVLGRSTTVAWSIDENWMPRWDRFLKNLP